MHSERLPAQSFPRPLANRFRELDPPLPFTIPIDSGEWVKPIRIEVFAAKLSESLHAQQERSCRTPPSIRGSLIVGEPLVALAVERSGVSSPVRSRAAPEPGRLRSLPAALQRIARCKAGLLDGQNNAMKRRRPPSILLAKGVSVRLTCRKCAYEPTNLTKNVSQREYCRAPNA